MASRSPQEQGEKPKARDSRMRRRADFLATYDGGTKAHGKLIVLFVRRREEEGPWRLGLTATRKLGGATVRNRMRRRAREIFRRWGAMLPAGRDFVLNFKHGAAAASHEDLLRDLTACLRRSGIEVAPPESARSRRPDGSPNPSPESPAGNPAGSPAGTPE